MTDLSPFRPRVALMIDGDNLSHNRAGSLILKSAAYGTLAIKRVYGNMTKHPGWEAAPGFRCVHSGTGKNASDLLLAVEATSLILTRQADILVIASSDGDFSHLALHLTERGHKVVGLGEAKAPLHFQKSCTDFHVLSADKPGTAATRPAADPLVDKARNLITLEPDGLAITVLSTRLAKNNEVQISGTVYKTWRKFFASFSDVFICDAPGPDARVRLRA